jgi:hypothetical protein
MKKHSLKEHPLCAICLFVRTYGLSRRPHELNIIALAGAFSFALVVAAMVLGICCVIIAGSKFQNAQ